MKNFNFLMLYFALSFAIAGCEKSIEDPTTEAPVDNRETFEDDPFKNLVKDSILYYTKVFSLWESSMPPEDLNDILIQDTLRGYTKYYETGQDVLSWLMSLTPIDPTTGNPIDRFSFLDRQGAVSSEIQEAVATSYGMYLIYLQTNPAVNNAELYVRMVDAGSPADGVGIQRGSRIISINGNSEIDYVTQEASDFEFLNNALSASSMNIVFLDENNQEVTASIRSSIYTYDPILAVEVFDLGTKKAGYLAFSSFVSITNTNGSYTQMYRDFEDIFSTFASSGISDLIIDLRYNGGGLVETAEYLADEICPSSANGQLMFTYDINDLLESEGFLTDPEYFGPVSFRKSGSLNLSQVYFLVTNETASASELLINVLEPYMDVLLVGAYGSNSAKENTYGKPIGFFAIPIVSDDIELYPTSFQMFNSEGYGDYFGGLVPDIHTYEDFLKDFGDPEEGLIAEALYHIQNNKFYNAATAKSAIASIDKLNAAKVVAVKSIGKNQGAKGMFKFNKDQIKLK
ncbi:S41 family peptidase [Sphingobacterium hungaricum]|uniref:Peptidase S41 n=1 Tax=Sphingobacterium hungaricum TaxID=2082723 RepID=A0A928YRG6_9SPHI|nr:S41 family peptidase [Sphingobacterium hungaricum]MBE8713308.1 peptidase S41 [Sphingobacterium hungaricum]